MIKHPHGSLPEREVTKDLSKQNLFFGSPGFLVASG